MCSCRKRKISGMSKKKISIEIEDIVTIAGGAALSFAANGILNKALANMPQKEMIGKALPFAKAGLGVFLATNKKNSRMIKLLGAGVVGGSAIELGVKFAPQFFSIAGLDQGDVFSQIGNSDVLALPITPSASDDLEALGEVGEMFEEEEILGVEDEVLL